MIDVHAETYHAREPTRTGSVFATAKQAWQATTKLIDFSPQSGAKSRKTGGANSGDPTTLRLDRQEMRSVRHNFLLNKRRLDGPKNIRQNDLGQDHSHFGRTSVTSRPLPV
jgi:hypothetical protein